MKNSFWTGGPQAYVQGLEDHFRPLLDRLQSQLEQASTETDRQTLQAEIGRLESEWKSKLDGLNDLLF